MKYRVLSLILAILAIISLTACGLSGIIPEFESEQPFFTAESEIEKESVPETGQTDPDTVLPESGEYDSRDEVALYINIYGHLPSNYITKKEAEALGWSGGGLDRYAAGKSIGGSRFGNYEGRLPEAPGREYFECDIDTRGKSSRGAKRIVYSNDGLIYYTEDHYESFVLLYGNADT